MKPKDITIRRSYDNPWWAYAEANGKEIAMLIQDDADTLWRLHRLSNTGMIDAWVLRAIADCLDEMNREHNEALDAAYKALPDERLEGE